MRDNAAPRTPAGETAICECGHAPSLHLEGTDGRRTCYGIMDREDGEFCCPCRLAASVPPTGAGERDDRCSCGAAYRMCGCDELRGIAEREARAARPPASGTGDTRTTALCECGGFIMGSGGVQDAGGSHEGYVWGGNCNRCGRGYGENEDELPRSPLAAGVSFPVVPVIAAAPRDSAPDPNDENPIKHVLAMRHWLGGNTRRYGCDCYDCRAIKQVCALAREAVAMKRAKHRRAALAAGGET